MSVLVELPAVQPQPTVRPSRPRRLLNRMKTAMLNTIIKKFRLAAEFAYELATRAVLSRG